MSAAQRTPRYNEAIVLPLRPTPRLVEAIEAPAPAPAAPLRAPARGPKAKPRPTATPSGKRPWSVLLVPASPSAPTRAFRFAQWQARALMALGTLAVVLTLGVIAAVVVAVQSPDLFTDSSEATLLRGELQSTRDSLLQVRTSLASLEAEEALRDSAAAAARAREAAAAAIPRSPDGLPVIGVIASPFARSRPHPLLHLSRPHLGVDIAARRGTPVTAPASGRVTFVGWRFQFGLVVEIAHSGGISTRYAHLQSATVRVGEPVMRGELIANVGASGLATGPHLHYEVMVHGHQVDPLRFRLPE